jgi:phosphatidate cytidylyltransferase
MKKMNELTKRSITAFFFTLVVLGCILWDQWSFVALLVLIHFFCLWEYVRIVEIKGMFAVFFIFISGFLLFFLFLAFQSEFIGLKYVLLFPFILILNFIIGLKNIENNGFRNIVYALGALIYISLPLSLAFFLVFSGGNYDYSLFLPMLIILWANDTFAYLTGYVLGKTLLAPTVSPKKTWEGFWGGFVFSLATAFVFSLFFNNLSLIQWLLSAMIITVFATLGDLTESLLKRNHNRKDSGNLLPGHGGFLDRFDALLFVIPAFLTYIYLLT